jgi:hypothetical protein
MTGRRLSEHDTFSDPQIVTDKPGRAPASQEADGKRVVSSRLVWYADWLSRHSSDCDWPSPMPCCMVGMNVHNLLHIKSNAYNCMASPLQLGFNPEFLH